MHPTLRLTLTIAVTAWLLAIAPTRAAPPAAGNTPTPAKSTPPGPTKFAKSTAHNATKNPHAPANRSTRVVHVVETIPGSVDGVPLVHVYHRGSLVGTVTNAAGGVVPMASVTLMPPGWHHRNRHVHPFFATMTNAAGSFNFHLIRARHYQLIVSKRAVGRSDRLVRVASGLPTRVTVALHAPSAKHHKHKRHK